MSAARFKWTFLAIVSASAALAAWTGSWMFCAGVAAGAAATVSLVLWCAWDTGEKEHGA